MAHRHSHKLYISNTFIKLTSVTPDPNIPDDMIYYNPSDKTGFYAYRMGTICAIAEMELNLPE